MTDEIHELSGAYAVDALDDVERARFERHLSDCSDCRDEVESLSVAAAELSSVTEMAPPARLRASVLASITSVRQLPPLAEAAGHTSTATDTLSSRRLEDPDSSAVAARPVDADEAPVVPLAPFGEPAGGPITSIWNGSRHRAAQGRRIPWSGLVAASAAAVLVIGTFTIVRGLLADKVPQSASQRVLEAPDATKTMHNFANGGSATIVRSASLGKAVLVGTNLPSPGAGKTYQLWLQSKTRVFTSAGIVPGDGDQVVVLGGDAATAAAAGITIEPTGGSRQPTTEPLAIFPFSA